MQQRGKTGNQYSGGAVVSPSDTANSNVFASLYTVSAGVIKLTGADGVDLLVSTTAATAVLPIAVTRVYSTGTTSTPIYGLK